MLNMDGADSRTIRKLLKNIDKGFDVGFDPEIEKYLIFFNDEHFQTVPFGEVTEELLFDIRHTFWLNRTGQILNYVDEENEKLEAEQDRKRSDMARAMAEDMRKPLLRDYYYGG